MAGTTIFAQTYRLQLLRSHGYGDCQLNGFSLSRHGTGFAYDTDNLYQPLVPRVLSFFPPVHYGTESPINMLNGTSKWNFAMPNNVNFDIDPITSECVPRAHSRPELLLRYDRPQSADGFYLRTGSDDVTFPDRQWKAMRLTALVLNLGPPQWMELWNGRIAPPLLNHRWYNHLGDEHGPFTYPEFITIKAIPFRPRPLIGSLGLRGHHNA